MNTHLHVLHVLYTYALLFQVIKNTHIQLYLVYGVLIKALDATHILF